MLQNGHRTDSRLGKTIVCGYISTNNKVGTIINISTGIITKIKTGIITVTTELTNLPVTEQTTIVVIETNDSRLLRQAMTYPVHQIPQLKETQIITDFSLTDKKCLIQKQKARQTRPRHQIILNIFYQKPRNANRILEQILF